VERVPLVIQSIVIDRAVVHPGGSSVMFWAGVAAMAAIISAAAAVMALIRSSRSDHRAEVHP